MSLDQEPASSSAGPFEEVPERARVLSDRLHRALAGGGGQCWAVLDVGTRAPTADESLSRLLEAPEAQAVGSPHAALTAFAPPVLIEMDTTTSRGSELLQLSIEEALWECAGGVARRVCGWVQTVAPSTALLASVRAGLVPRTPERRQVLFRWIDPRVLWALWPLLDLPQRAALLGPVDVFWLLDPAATLAAFSRPEKGAAGDRPLELSALQWADLSLLPALHEALRQWRTYGRSAAELENGRACGMAALRRAWTLGFGDHHDLVAFGRLALEVHPRFDRHPELRRRLSNRSAGDYFTALIDDLDDADWRGLLAGWTG